MRVQVQIISCFAALTILGCSNHDQVSGNINTDASLPDSFEYSPKNMKVITAYIDQQQGTMSTLYGNSMAFQQASNANGGLVPGELFTLITWKQQPDKHWFGANIPGALQSVEILETRLNGITALADYKLYEGKSLALSADTSTRAERIQFIMNLRPAVMP